MKKEEKINKFIQLKVDPEERDLIKKAAKMSGLTMSSYLRFLGLSHAQKKLEVQNKNLFN